MNIDEYDLSDEEKSFQQWISENPDIKIKYEQSLDIIKESYIRGFGNGWQYRKCYNAMEWLQK